ncbi:MAG: S8 family serine peptidase [Planctomycetaceae bacterium]|nr:S8 family serine peptidase [Planctomycetaceae bacterium]
MQRILSPGIFALLLTMSPQAGFPVDGPPVVVESAFPFQNILPKTETGAARFLERFPEFDGRGVTVAIFDTGVDPGAPGLQTTTDGQPKIIDIIDGTGAGDVSMTTVVTATEGKITGTTGRELTLGDWRNPSGEYRIGRKAGYDFFPLDLVPRLKKDRRDAFEKEVGKLIEDVERQRSDKPQENSPSEQEWKARLEVLRKALDNYEDPGPIYDCVLFHDGEVWKAVIDTDEDGDLAEETVLSDYQLGRQYATFGEDSLLNFSVKIYDDGDLLSIVCASGDHGTHVAGIVAANFPDQPARNGLAPGVRLISVTIGDPRVGGMETGTAMVRALRAVVEHDCDLINMSFGEPTSTANEGRLAELFNEIVREHGVIFCASAGNSGPALLTVGAPGGTTNAVIGVGAYVSPEMWEAQYSLSKDAEGMPYTWTSRGPTADGDAGVDLFAPGGAIAPIPSYSLQPGQRMNGTSMASPNACGNIALLVSALKQQGKSFSPISVLRSLQTTSEHLTNVDAFAQGPGLVQIDAAYDHHLKWGDQPGQLTELVTTIPDRDARGVYLREPWETDRELLTTVEVEPFFSEDIPAGQKLDFEIALKIRASADWIEVGENILVHSGGGDFAVSVHPEKLRAGVHTAEITGKDPDHPERGPLFRVPVTVIKTEPFKADTWSGQIETTGGDVQRRFFAVPSGAGLARLRLRGEQNGGSRFFYLHAVQLVPGQTFEDHERLVRIGLTDDELYETAIPVVGGRTLEICLGQFWSDPGEARLSMEVEFTGPEVSDNAVTLPGNGEAVQVHVTGVTAFEKFSPQARLDHAERILLPESAKIELLTSSRDQYPDGTQPFRLLLNYKYERHSGGNVELIAPALNGHLYDSPVDSFRILIHGENNQLVEMEDLYPGDIKLTPGTFEFAVELRHADRKPLEGYQQLPLVVRDKLKNAIPVRVERTPTTGDAIRSTELHEDEQVPVYLRLPLDTDIPKFVEDGDQLTGTFSLDGDHSVPLRLVVRKPREESSKPMDKSRSLEEASQKFYFDRLDSLDWDTDRDQIEEIITMLADSGATALEIAVAKLELLDDDDRKQRLPEVVQAADAVIKEVPEKAVRLHFAVKSSGHSDKQKKSHTLRTRQRDALIDALYRKGRALAYMELPDVVKDHPIKNPEKHDRQFEQNYKRLAGWVDVKEEKYALLHVRRERRKEHYGQALQVLNSLVDKHPQNFLPHKKRRDIYELLGWDVLRSYEQHWMWRISAEQKTPF